MSDKIELLPCPFCGASDLLGFEPSHEGGWTVVKCRKCGCSGSTGRSTSEQEAIAWWNRRAALTQQPATVAAHEPVAWTVSVVWSGRRMPLGTHVVWWEGETYRIEPSPESQDWPKAMQVSAEVYAKHHAAFLNSRDPSNAAVAVPLYAEQPDPVKVSRELLEKWERKLSGDNGFGREDLMLAELQALLAGGEG